MLVRVSSLEAVDRSPIVNITSPPWTQPASVAVSEGAHHADTQFTVHTRLTPSDVLALLTDFGPDRASRGRTSTTHISRCTTGPDWAEVTEGNELGWERERYTWDAAAGTVTIETLESNLWGPGSGWRYQLSLRTAARTCR